MAGLWNRIKSWLQNENLSNADLNAEFNNMISQIAASTISGASNYPATVAGMQATTSPGSVGSEVLPTSVQDEIRELRYQVSQIIGGAQWYSGVPASLTTLNSTVSGLSTLPQSRIISGRKDTNDQPMFLVPNGAAASVSFQAASTNAVVYTNGNLRTVSSNLTLSSLTTAPSTNNTCTVNDSTLAGAQATKIQGERGTTIAITSIGSNISALNGSYAAFKVSTEYFIAEVDTTNNVLKNCFRGVGFDSADSWKSRVAISNTNTITLMKLAYIFLEYSSGFGLGVTYNKPTVAYVQPTSPSIGDRWYDLTNNTWKNYNGTSWVSIEAVFAGIAICDSSNCVSARSGDFFKTWNELNTIELEYVGTSSVRATKRGTKISVYGTSYSYDFTQPIFSTSTTLDSGVSLAASTTYYCYITDLGDIKVSDVAPSERKYDLLGSYHPSKPWRAVGEFATDLGQNILQSSISVFSYYGNQLSNATTSFINSIDKMNFLANGAFDFWQRQNPVALTNGTSTYVPDRWYIKNGLGTGGANITVTQRASTFSGSTWDCELKITAAPTGAQANVCELYQVIENALSLSLYGQTASFSIQVKALGNVNSIGVQFYYKTTEAKVDTGIGTEQTFTVNTSSFTPCYIVGQNLGTAQTASGVIGVRIRIFGVSSGNAYDLNNGFVVSQAMLNIGPTPLSFRRMFPTIGAELSYCERFYEKTWNLTTAVGTNTEVGAWKGNVVASATVNGAVWPLGGQPRFKVRKRAAPTVTLWDNAGTTGKWIVGGNGTQISSSANVSESGFDVTNASGGSVTPGAAIAEGHFTADADI